ncbi:unnamed protein product [Candidula unifasciata]|uniref:Serine/threonine-protein kinase Nek2 n=1 Tax=Candidula unifasciata TaxID=100452 RepID=A0A8S3Z6N9_9EUPU|nr:unnamed protein product [Candidula unifasciata]
MPSTLDDFEVISTIGTGSYGTCKKIRRKKDGKIMVWKEMEYGTMTESEKQMLVSEVNLLRELRHQHIVRYHDRIIDRSRAIIYIIMEYCQGGDLDTIIVQNRKEGTHVPEDFAWKILIQTTLALKECHQRKNGKAVLHRDLKPANVFLDAESNVKLGDFGLARVLHHESSFAKTYVGTPYYMSPELVNNQSYNEKSDIWSLGCMLYELCALVPPFTASNQSELNRKIRTGDFPRIPSQYSLELDLIIRKMIQVEVIRRPNIDAILADPLIQRKQDSLARRNGNRNKKLEFDRVTGSGDQGDVRYEDFLAKMRQLELKEKELESREKTLALREKLFEERVKRAKEADRYQHPDSTSINQASPATSYTPCADEDSFTHPSSCLSSGSKDPDSPKKHVTFHDYLNGKENLRQNKSFIFNSYTGTYSMENFPRNDPVKHEDIRDRLFRVKERPVATRDFTGYPKLISRNLLHFR